NMNQGQGKKESWDSGLDVGGGGG
ncbi:hypothetical protein A2U01_0009088, partial [Trifolium medium]|nr:hypothetical protein [Trifolium medium]